MIAWICAGLAASAVEPPVRSAPPDGPDRAAPPAVRESEALPLPLPEVRPLSPGITAWHVAVPGVRRVAVHVVLGRGLVDVPDELRAAARVAGALVEVGGRRFGPRRLARVADLHDVDVASRIGRDDGEVWMVAPKEELATGLDLLSAVLARPRFPRPDLRRHLEDHEVHHLLEAPSSPEAVASYALRHAWFAADHPYGARPDIEGVARVRRRDARAAWAWWRSHAPVTVVVVGDVAWDDVESGVRRAVVGLGVDVPPSGAVEVPEPAPRVIAVDMPGQEQVSVRLRLPAPSERHPDHAAMWATNWALGGHFLSRLNRVLREERDLTYGADTRYRYGGAWGTLTLSVSVAAESLPETVRVVREQIDGFLDEGLTGSERAGARRAALREWNTHLQSAEDASWLYLDLLEHGWRLSDLKNRRIAIGTFAAGEVAEAARSWLGSERGRIWVFVGERAKMEAGLKSAGLDPEWVSPAEAVLGDF